MAGLVAYGTYLPRWRLDRAAIADALDATPMRGSRAVASYDEDATSMGVEAARNALHAAPGFRPDVVLFATSTPPYAEKTNASSIHAALGLLESTAAYDVAGAARSASGALRLAMSASLDSLVVSADVRTGMPGSNDESDGGDAAAAFAFSASGLPLVDVIGQASSSDEFLDRWRTPGAKAAKVWEERFGETVYVPLAETALTEALKRAGVTVDEVDHLVVAGLHTRAARAVIRATGVPAEKVANDLVNRIGNPGSAQPGLLLADVLDRARPESIILLVHLADGVDVTVLRVTVELEAYRARRATTVSAQVDAGRAGLSYARFLTWRGLLDREPPRRPDPDAPAAPVSFRREAWKFGFSSSTCEGCGTRHMPPTRVCVRCRAVDHMQMERLADVRGTVVTFTVDHLAYSLNPPVVAAVVDFDGGGRFPCELTDVLPDDVLIGSRVAMSFRRLFTAANGVHNYFWKARLINEGNE